MRRIETRIRLFFKVMPTIYCLTLGLALLFVTRSATISMSDRCFWCYQLAKFFVLPIVISVFEKIWPISATVKVKE